MSTETGKAVGLRFLREVLDNQHAVVLEELFHQGARRHVPSRKVVMRAGAMLPPSNAPHVHTGIHDMFAEGDMVAVRLTHHVAFAPGTHWASQAGTVPTNGQSVVWDATALFRVVDGRIAGEWVNRDDLAVLRQLDAIGLTQG